MKVTVEIPGGEFCGECIFLFWDGVPDYEEELCIYLKETLKKHKRMETCKHPGCPSLKEEK